MPKLILAPIRGVTTSTFRKVYSKYFSGFDEAMAPFIPTTIGNKISHSHMRDILPENNTVSIPLIPQLIGKVSSEFIIAANFMADRGYKEVNWNMGCPSPAIIKKGRGAGLIPSSQTVSNLLSDVTKNSNINISVKIRLGMSNPDELFDLIPILNDSRISVLTIHPRTALQGYSGEIDLKRYGKVLNLLNIPTFLSGDINSLDIYNNLAIRFPKTAGWMLGRGALRNPFLPAIIKGEHDENDRDYLKIKQFHDTLFSEYSKELFGPAPLLGRMKELWSYLFEYFDNKKGKKLFKKIKKSVKPNRYRKIVDEFFSELT